MRYSAQALIKIHLSKRFSEGFTGILAASVAVKDRTAYGILPECFYSIYAKLFPHIVSHDQRQYFSVCVGHDTNLTGESPVTGSYRQV